MKPLRTPRMPSRTTRPRSTHHPRRNHFGRMDVQSNFRHTQHGCAATRVRIDLHAHDVVTVTRNATRRRPFDAHPFFAPADRRTRLNAAQPGAEIFLRASIDCAPTAPRRHRRSLFRWPSTPLERTPSSDDREVSFRRSRSAPRNRRDRAAHPFLPRCPPSPTTTNRRRTHPR